MIEFIARLFRSSSKAADNATHLIAFQFNGESEIRTTNTPISESSAKEMSDRLNRGATGARYWAVNRKTGKRSL